MGFVRLSLDIDIRAGPTGDPQSDIGRGGRTPAQSNLSSALQKTFVIQILLIIRSCFVMSVDFVNTNGLIQTAVSTMKQ